MAIEFQLNAFDLKIAKRLNVFQTAFGENVEFSMRTFRFTSVGSVNAEEQQQTIECDLYLEPIDDITETQAEDCSCYTQEECDSKFFQWFSFVCVMSSIKSI